MTAKNQDLRVNRGEFLNTVARKTGYERKVVIEIYHAMVEEMVNVLQSGKKLSLTGLGSFYVQQHKGHPVQFSGGSYVVDDYNVMKFSASNMMNKRVRNFKPLEVPTQKKDDSVS